jgi:hypothetical protein
MDSNEVQEANAPDPNSVTVDGDSKATITKASHWMKAHPPSCVTEIGMQTDFSEIQPSKAWKEKIRIGNFPSSPIKWLKFSNSPRPDHCRLKLRFSGPVIKDIKSQAELALYIATIKSASYARTVWLRKSA